MNSKYNIALIGCGAISHTHIDSLKKLEECKIKAVCDVDSDALKLMSERLECDAYENYEDILCDKTIDAVHILTPHHLHVPIAIRALEEGKNVLLEKPVGVNLEELRRLKAAEKNSEGRISVVFQNRYNNTTVMMKKMMDEDSLGDFKTAKAIVTWHRDDDYYLSSSWRGKSKTEGGGLLINQAIHTLDLLRYLGGSIQIVNGHVDNYAHDIIEVEDTAMAFFQYKNGAIGNFYGTNNNGINSKIEIELVFSNGIFKFVDDKLYHINKYETKLMAEDIILEGKKSYWGVSHDACIKAFYDALDKDKTFDITLDDAIATNEIVFGIYKSSETKEEYFLTEG